MRSPLFPIVACGLILAVGGKFVRKSYDAAMASQGRLAQSQAELASLRQQELALSSTRKQLNADAVHFDKFLTEWENVYVENHSRTKITSGLGDIGDQTHVLVVDNKPTDFRVKIKDTDFTGTKYSIRVIGPYSNLLRFVGKVEERFEILSVQDVTVSRNLNEVSMQITFCLPNFTFQTS